MNELDQIEEKLNEAIRRDTNHILGESAGKKLSPASARDLVAYKKLMVEIREASEKAAKSLPKLSTEELNKLLQDMIK